jgi:hypothetical protein
VTEERSESGDVGALRTGVIAVAIRYRDAMRAYMVRQAEAVERGALLDELVMGNWQTFQEAARAEAVLFALLDALDAMQAGQVIEARAINQSE